MKIKQKELIEMYIDQLDYGPKRTLLRIISRCKGHENAIPREEAKQAIANIHAGIKLANRTWRMYMEDYRNHGIRALDLEDGEGAFIPKTDDDNDPDYIAFKRRYASKSYTMLATVRAMDRQVNVEIVKLGDSILDQISPPAKQLDLFGVRG